MAKESNNGTFIFGALLGGVAGVACAITHAPRSGEQTRADIVERFEWAIFRALGKDDLTTWKIGAPAPVAPVTDPAPTPEPAAPDALDVQLASETVTENVDASVGR